MPESSNRREVLRAIHLFIAMELRELACDYMVIATTRAQGYNHEFDEERYRHLEVTEFSEEDCCRYIEKLFAVMEEQSVRREEYVRIMKEALSDSITGRLMKTPLQVTIIAILVKRGGKPPHDRYSLFREYYETVVSREKQKEIVEMLNENTDWLEELHYLTGLGLQCGSQQQENAAAEISLEELRSVIRTYVEENRDDFYEDKADCERKAEEFLRTMTQRICFLCENRSGFYSFQIRSVQEFFAGTCLVKGKSDGEVMENIRRIAYSAYWRNVFLFALGYMERERKSLEPWVGALCEQMNGKENFLQEDYTPENLCLFGSWLALDILTEDLFRGKQQEKYIVLASGAAAFAGHADYQKFSLLTGVRRDRLLRYLQQNACRDAALQESSLNVYLKMHENEKNNLEEEIIQLCGQLPPERRTAACVLILENLVGDGGRLAEYAGSKLETALEQGEVRQLLPCRILGFLLYRKGRERSAELKKNLFLQCLYCEDWNVSAAWKWQALGVQCDIALLRGYLTPWGRGTLSQNMILNLTDSFEIMVKDQVLRRETLTEIQAEVQKLNAGFLAEFCAFLLEPSLEKYRELCSLADSGEDYLTGKYRALVRYYAPYDQVETEEAFQAAWRRREEDLGRFVRREFGELYFRETDVRFYSSVGCRSDAFDELTEQGIIPVERIEELSDGFLQQFLFAAGVQLECVRQIADISESTAEYFGRMVAEASRRNLYAYHMTDILAVLMSPKFRKRFWEQCPDFGPVERIAEEELRERKWRRHRVPCISAEEAETIIGNIIHKVIYEAEESSYLALIPWLIDDKTDLKRCISGNDLKQLCQTDCRSESNRLTVKLLRMCLEENREPGRVVEEILQTGVPRAVIFTELENMLHFCEAENKEKLWVRTYLELMDETFAGSGELRGRILGDMAELRSASRMPDYFMYALSTRSTT